MGRVAPTLALLASLACNRETGKAADSAASGSRPAAATTPRTDSSPAAAGAPAGTTAATAPNAAGCISEGVWQPCSVEKRLTDAGFVPIRKGSAPGGVFDVQGTTYALGAAELNVYVFKSAKDRETASAAIDTVTVTKTGGASPWTTPPTFISSNNLIAVLLSDNGRLIERVQLAITAGLPSAQH
ncbi:MAG TPA: hypothetical protein VM076_23860 [Gemmatimonadaceae bacterium]|nr:hypothetical protein [Gemmatimonadaceae bacterium]